MDYGYSAGIGDGLSMTVVVGVAVVVAIWAILWLMVPFYIANMKRTLGEIHGTLLRIEEQGKKPERATFAKV